MSDDGATRLERLLEATARKVSGGQLHPLELLQRLQSVAEASVRDGALANDYVVTLNLADYARYLPAQTQFCREAAKLLQELQRRHGWGRIGAMHVALRASDDSESDTPTVLARFVEERGRESAAPPGATRRINRHRNLLLRLGDGSSVPLTHTPFTIGRGPGNDLVLPVLSVSRHHAELVRLPGGLVLRDLGSRNGLVVAGVRVAEHAMDDGQPVALGDVEIRLERT